MFTVFHAIQAGRKPTVLPPLRNAGRVMGLTTETARPPAEIITADPYPA